jgi:hypothetical protein
MKTNELKTLIKEAVREVLKEELAELGKQKLSESVSYGLPYTPPPASNNEAWPTMNFNTSNTNPALRNSLMEKMGIADAMKPEPPKTFGEKQAAYSDLLSQVAAEMRSNPADLNNFRSVQ